MIIWFTAQGFRCSGESCSRLPVEGDHQLTEPIWGVGLARRSSYFSPRFSALHTNFCPRRVVAFSLPGMDPLLSGLPLRPGAGAPCLNLRYHGCHATLGYAAHPPPRPRTSPMPSPIPAWDFRNRAVPDRQQGVSGDGLPELTLV